MEQYYIETIDNLVRKYDEKMAVATVHEATAAYEQLRNEIWPSLSKKPAVFRTVIDQLLQSEHPLVRIEIATEAIGLNYRLEEAVTVLETLATWRADWTAKEQSYAETALRRLHALFHYEESWQWQRPNVLDLSEEYRTYFARRKLDEHVWKVPVYIQNHAIISCRIESVTHEEEFIVRGQTSKGKRVFYLVDIQAQVIQCFLQLQAMAPFVDGQSIVQTDDELYGVLDRTNNWIIRPYYKQVMRLNRFFYIALESEEKGHVYNCYGQKIISHIDVYYVCCYEDTFIYRNRLFNIAGELIMWLHELGTNWHVDATVDGYLGFHEQTLIAMNKHGKRIPILLENETVYPFEGCAIECIKNETIVRVHDETYVLQGAYVAMLQVHENKGILLQRIHPTAPFVWIHWQSKKIETFHTVKQTPFAHFFAKQPAQSEWCAFTLQKKLKLPKRLFYVDEGYSALEDEQLAKCYVLPKSQKLLREKQFLQALRKRYMVKVETKTK